MQYFVVIKSKMNNSEALEAARRHSPNIEIVDEKTLVFDLTGSRAREASKIAAGLRQEFAAVAVSENLGAALLLATWSQAREFQVSSSGEVSSSKFQVPSSSKQTLNSEPETQNPPADELFKMPKSEYRAGPLITSGEEFNARTDRDRRRKPQLRSKNSEPGTRNSPSTQKGARDEGRGTGEQTRNSERGTLNSPRVDAADATYAGGGACAPVVTARECEDTGSGKQTLNFEPGTLNLKPGTWNPHLSALPVEALGQKQEFLDLMDSWAIYDLGSFAALPEDDMVARFGLEIVDLQKRARGEAFRAVNWNVRGDKFFWAKDLEGAIETIEPLNFVLSKGVAQIFQNLDYAGLSTQSSKIILRGREKKKVYRIRIVFPTKNQKLWIRQIVTRIGLDTPEFNIDRVEIEFRSTKPRTVQNNLYSGAILEPENLDLIVSKLKKVVGLTKIGVPRLRDAWRERFYMTDDLSALIAESEFKVQGSNGVSSSKFQVSSLSKQTRNTELETLNLPSADAADATYAGEGACAPVVTAREAEDAGSGQQTLNLEPGTLNPPQAPRNTEPGTLNPPKEPETLNLPAERECQVSSSKFQVSSLSEQTRNTEPGTLNSYCFYYLPQPVKARVFFESGEPKALLIKGKREMVKTSGGPWRMDAEWYEASEWRREEWDIETETGAVYRVFVDKNGEAFIDGGYD